MAEPKEVPVVSIRRVRGVTSRGVEEPLRASCEIKKLRAEGDVPVSVIFENEG